MTGSLLTSLLERFERKGKVEQICFMVARHTSCVPSLATMRSLNKFYYILAVKELAIKKKSEIP